MNREVFQMQFKCQASSSMCCCSGGCLFTRAGFPDGTGPHAMPVGAEDNFTERQPRAEWRWMDETSSLAEGSGFQSSAFQRAFGTSVGQSEFRRERNIPFHMTPGIQAENILCLVSVSAPLLLSLRVLHKTEDTDAPA